MEYSVHSVPAAYTHELSALFPKADLSSLLIVPTCQRSTVDLANVGEAVEGEKDRCLETFVAWAAAVAGALADKGHLADYTDPCSGLLMKDRTKKHVYGEVDALAPLLQYKTANSGCCKIVLHPTWGSSVYP